MHIKQLQYFVSVASYLSFSKAAQHLYISQPALSKQIKLLEDELGLTLFTRNKRSVTLTPIGEEFYARAKNVISDYNDLLEWTSAISKQNSSLVIGYSGFIFQDILSSILKNMEEYYPQIHVCIRQKNINQLSGLLKKDKIDIAISNSSYFLEQNNINCVKLCTIRYKLIVSSDHPLAKRPSVRFEELKNENFIVFSKQEFLNTYNETLHMLQNHNIIPPKIYECDDPTTFYMLVQAGKGIAIAGAREKSLHGYDIKLVDIEDLNLHKDIFAIWNASNINHGIPYFLKVAQKTTKNFLDKDIIV